MVLVDDQLIGALVNPWRGSIIWCQATSYFGETDTSFPERSVTEDYTTDNTCYEARSWMGDYACSAAGDYWEVW
jgi:hypothetical protein